MPPLTCRPAAVPARCLPGSPCGLVRTAGPGLPPCYGRTSWMPAPGPVCAVRCGRCALRSGQPPTVTCAPAGISLSWPATGSWWTSANSGGCSRPGCPAGAMALNRGDLLSEFDADWALDARDEHRDRLCAAYGALAAAAEADGDPAAACDWASKRAAGKPLDEHGRPRAHPAAHGVRRPDRGGGRLPAALDAARRGARDQPGRRDHQDDRRPAAAAARRPRSPPRSDRARRWSAGTVRRGRCCGTGRRPVAAGPPS